MKTKPVILSKLDLEATGSGWRLTSEFRAFVPPSIVSVPKGFPTDLASAKMGNWQLMGTTREAAVIHDYLYATGERGKLMADLAFYRLLRQAKTDRLRAALYTAAVLVKGWSAYRAHRRGNTAAVKFLRLLHGDGFASVENHP
jgi:Protein of unknown function (DUF1353)